MNPESSMPLTLEEHRELGHELRAMNSRLRELGALIVRVYGGQNPAASDFTGLTQALERLRGELQAQAAQDLPGYPMNGVYF
jgi:hypothetical protein